MDRTIRAETALHIAVKNSKLEACKVLLGWLRRSLNLQLLNSEDEKGNTVQHIAVSNSEIEIVKLLVAESYMNMNKKNLEGLTALGIAAKLKRERPSGATTEIEAILRGAGAFQSSSSPTHYSRAGFLKSPERRIEKIIKGSIVLEIFSKPNFFSTSTYHAILSPPGGVRGLGGGDNNNQLTTDTNGTLIYATIISTAGLPTNISLFNATIFTPSATNTTYNPANQVLYHAFKKDFTYGQFFTLFYFLNTVCFFFSIVTIVAVLPLNRYNILWYGSLSFLIMSYGFSFFVISPSHSNTNYFLIASYIFGIYFGILVIYPITIGVLGIRDYMLGSDLLGEHVEMLKLCLKGRPQKSD
ncbi:ankyrin repeat-containing protein BDA1-like isoform X2 [Camellia sinensis]|nr:ankyrin repeat-containing protein BDA1-like isoform X2 [Camellia sinensis]